MPISLTQSDCRKAIKCGASLIALSVAVAFTPAQAQDAGSPAPAPAAVPAEEQPAAASGDEGQIVVTGSRIARTGFQAPTPTTVMGAEELQRAAPVNIADAVNELPQLSATTTPRTGNGGTSGGTNGINSLNLRSLGVNRTLVLLDGQRVAPASINGAVDINNLPTALVQQVEIVTGGASAVYGSDAVAGVVNFIVNKRFTGLKGSVAGGITDRGDGKSWNAELAGGMAFAGGRGHILASGEIAWTEGVDKVDPTKRTWWKSCNMLTFAATVQPRRIVACGVNTRFETYGGVITSTSLQNTMFGSGGAVGTFIVGNPQDSLFMVGGTPYSEGTTIALEAGQRRHSLWGRVSYEITDNITANIEGSYGFSHSDGHAAYQRYAGNTALTIRADNPYLPASVAAQAAAAKITTFRYGYSTIDLGLPQNWADRTSYRGVVSLEGRFGGSWKWDAYYQYGQTQTAVELRNTTNTARIMQAIDATRDATGKIVCRDPSNGCVPLNIFGVGVADPAAVAYVKGVATQDLTLKQQVAAASVTGDLINLWAGPLSVAAGGEWRKESISGTSDAISQANGFFTGNFKPTVGSFDVKEVFGEVDLPLMKDMRFAQALDFSGAVRYTDYSLSGTVTTWKAGLTWALSDEIRFRAVRSRDIRAPNIGELFQAGATARQDVVDTADPKRPTYSITRITSGNTNLKPEIADTTSFGVVIRPGPVPQLSLSVDYYSIGIAGAVGTLNNQQTVDRCVAGETSLCDLIIRNSAGAITQILGVPVNVAQQKVRGIDYEVSWRQDLGKWGHLSLRGLASNILDSYTLNNGVKTVDVGNNTGSTPHWRWLASATWDWNRVSVSSQLRGFSAGVYDPAWVSGIDIDNNEIAGANYLDLAATYRIWGEDEDRAATLFARVENLFDVDPVIIGGAGLSSLQANPALYDTIGRRYRAGIRFRY
jgi:outer membrane receptor protein involved in Fe transport